MTQENNRLTSENIALTRTMTGINLDTSSHSEHAAASAAKGSAAAEETSRATRVNVQVSADELGLELFLNKPAFLVHDGLCYRFAVLLLRSTALCL
jgi:hypothetical protein